MFIDPAIIPRLALQRSAMFAAMNRRDRRVSLLRSEDNLLERPSINITSLRDEELLYKSLVKKENKKSIVCIRTSFDLGPYWSGDSIGNSRARMVDSALAIPPLKSLAYQST